MLQIAGMMTMSVDTYIHISYIYNNRYIDIQLIVQYIGLYWIDTLWKINVKMILNIFIHSVCCGIDGGYGGQVVARAYWV